MVLLTAPSSARADAQIENFVGEWRGVEVNVEGAEQAPKLTPADLDMAITEENGGFRVRSLALARESDGSVVARQMDATFTPTETPGVFAFDAGDGDSCPACLPIRPWATRSKATRCCGRAWRRIRCTCTVWPSTRRVATPCEQSIGELTEDGMVTRYELRLENDRIVTVEGRLERAGD